MTRFEQLLGKIMKKQVSDPVMHLQLNICNAVPVVCGCNACVLNKYCKEEDWKPEQVEAWLRKEENGITNYEAIFPSVIKYTMAVEGKSYRQVLCEQSVECEDCANCEYCEVEDMSEEEFKSYMEEIVA